MMNSSQRRVLANIYQGPASVGEWEDRLLNAIIGLANNDPGWMSWVEKEITSDTPIEEATRLIEHRAKALALKPYKYFLGSRLIGLILSETYQFNSRGLLGPG